MMGEKERSRLKNSFGQREPYCWAINAPNGGNDRTRYTFDVVALILIFWPRVRGTSTVASVQSNEWLVLGQIRNASGIRWRDDKCSLVFSLITGNLLPSGNSTMTQKLRGGQRTNAKHFQLPSTNIFQSHLFHLAKWLHNPSLNKNWANLRLDSRCSVFITRKVEQTWD